MVLYTNTRFRMDLEMLHEGKNFHYTIANYFLQSHKDIIKRKIQLVHLCFNFTIH